MRALAATRKYDLYSDDFRATTYETFARMRADDPVFCQPGIDGEAMIWFVTRHDDVVSVFRHPDLASALAATELTEDDLVS